MTPGPEKTPPPTPIQKLFEKITPGETVRELANLTQSNPDNQQELMQDLAAHMLLPLGSFIQKHNQLEPGQLTIEWKADKTILELSQYNQTQTWKWPTPDIHNRIDQIVKQADPGTVYVAEIVEKYGREIVRVYSDRDKALTEKKAVEKNSDAKLKLHEVKLLTKT